MLRSALFWAQFCVLSVTAVFHLLALNLSLYWWFVWADVVPHFFGGMWAALFVLWLCTYLQLSWRPMYIIGGAVLIGLGWEAFEFAARIFYETHNTLDTSVDLLMDTIGAFIGLRLGQRLLHE